MISEWFSKHLKKDKREGLESYGAASYEKTTKYEKMVEISVQ